jgi:hypothetical protein
MLDMPKGVADLCRVPPVVRALVLHTHAAAA